MPQGSSPSSQAAGPMQSLPLLPAAHWPVIVPGARAACTAGSLAQAQTAGRPSKAASWAKHAQGLGCAQPPGASCQASGLSTQAGLAGWLP